MNESTKTSLKETIVGGLKESIEKSLPTNADGINRFEFELENISPIEWLSRQESPKKMYFSDRNKTLEIAATGSAKTLTKKNTKSVKDALDIIERTLTVSDPAIRYYGGICFDPEDEPAGKWESFGKYRFTVPEFELRTENKKTVFAFNLDLAGRQDIPGVLEELFNSIESVNFNNSNFPCDEKYTVINQQDYPDEKQWCENVTAVTAELTGRHIQKVVLARKSDLKTSVPVNAIEILRRLKNNNLMTYDFCFQFDGENAFVGCTPECLFSLRGKEIYSEAIAGTRIKGNNAEEQKKYHDELVDSEKEQLEHDYVFDDVSESLAGICESVEVAGRRQVVSLSHLQHFCSRFKGRLKNGVSVCDIIRSLHPTAAVNGCPSETAIKEIRKYEPFSRGWFAGPVGWIGRDSAHFAVALRSALVHKKQISLFAGAGIVKSSVPAQEWQETQNKIKQYLDVMK